MPKPNRSGAPPRTRPKPDLVLALRRTDAATALGWTEGYLRQREADGTAPPHVRTGKVVIYPVDRLREWIQRNTIDPSVLGPRPVGSRPAA